jgi:hypothetical protein
MTEVCQIPRDVVRLDRVSQQVSEMAFPLPRASFTRQGWQLDRPEVAALMDKIRRTGTPLKDYAGISPQYGIKTGYNEAFLIDTPARDALVAADPNCAEIIRPYLRGQDIERWMPRWKNLWMILMKSSSDYQWPWANAASNAESTFAGAYPSLFTHFKIHEDRLREREDQGRYWWELRPCSYYTAFSNDKMIYQVIQYYGNYAFDVEKRLSNDKTFILFSSDKFLLASLNSPLMWWRNWRYLTHLKDEALSPMGYRIESLPIAKPFDEVQAATVPTVDSLIDTRQRVAEASSLLPDWYATELGIAKPNQVLLEPFALTSDELVEQIRKARGRRKPLSAAAVHAIRQEYVKTVQPMQAALGEAERLEWRLNDLVNEAYGLTPDEVRLMWATAPPRMPLTQNSEEAPEVNEEAAE